NLKLRERLDRVCRTPVETDGLSERLWHMVDLAQKEAQEILDKAQAEAERRREELDKREAELKLRRAELESEHRELVHRIKAEAAAEAEEAARKRDRKSTRLNSSHVKISYAVFCLKKKNKKQSKQL